MEIHGAFFDSTFMISFSRTTLACLIDEKEGIPGGNFGIAGPVSGYIRAYCPTARRAVDRMEISA